jgi:endonuclease I
MIGRLQPEEEPTLQNPNVVRITSLLFALAGGVGHAATVASADQWSPPAGYYNAASGTGATLKGQLTAIMSSGHIQRTYGDFRSSAKIHDADPNVANNILLVYNRASVSGLWDSGATWNREHVWPQSMQPGSASNASTGNLGDPHALRPANPSINSSRGNKPFGLDNTTGGHGSLGTYYFPGDDDKGDIARSLFYSDTRWGASLGLALVDSVPAGNQMGDLSSLITWNYLDPPDTFERRRNHTIYSSAYNPSFYSNNRNAFIDHPEYVWSIYVDQNNDSTLYVGGGPGADGSSSTSAIVTSVVVDAPSPQLTTVTLNRTGFDGVFYGVGVAGEGFSTSVDSSNAFPINIGGSDSAVLTVGIDSASMSVAGLKTGQVIIDNLDVTSGAGLGMGAQDADDTIDVELAVLDHADASLSSGSDVNSMPYDFGSLTLNAGAANESIPVYNLEATPGFTADLDIVFNSSSGDTGVMAISEAMLEDIAAGGSSSLTVVIDDTAVGIYSASYTFRTFDDQDLAGSTEGAMISLDLAVQILSGACPSDLTGDNMIDGADLAILLSQWGGPGSADRDGSGTVGGADLAEMLAAWGACE